VKHFSHNAISRKLGLMVLNQGDADMVQQDYYSIGALIAGREHLSQHQLNDREVIGWEEFTVKRREQ
jgi:hypothetical protein